MCTFANNKGSLETLKYINILLFRYELSMFHSMKRVNNEQKNLYLIYQS